jgi:hypothetical protein
MERDEHLRAKVSPAKADERVGIEPFVVMTAGNPLTVTNANPTPPTNFASTGGTPPNPATYDPTVYNTATDPHYPRPDLAPFYDDGAAGAITAIAANHAALAVGGPSVASESTGTVVIVTAPGSVAASPTQSVSVAGTYSTTPNASHPSSQPPASLATITSISPNNIASGAGVVPTLLVNGTGFEPASQVLVNGVPMSTFYIMPTQISASNVPKRTTAGTWPVVVSTFGALTTPATTWTFT